MAWVHDAGRAVAVEADGGQGDANNHGESGGQDVKEGMPPVGAVCGHTALEDGPKVVPERFVCGAF